MDALWVKEKNIQRLRRMAELYGTIRSAVEDLCFYEEEDVNKFMDHVRERSKMGLGDSSYMFAPVLDERLQSLYGEDMLSLAAARVKTINELKKLPFSELEFLEHSSYEFYLDSEPMFFDGDIIITDPCYIMRNHDDWSKCCGDLEEVGIKNHITRDTIYGDWSCTTYNTDTGEKMGEFCADAGMVSVVTLEDVLKYNPSYNHHKENDWTVTWIRDFRGTVQFVVKEHRWIQEEDTPFHKNGTEHIEYYVEVVGHGINNKTGEPINFVGKQTGF